MSKDDPFGLEDDAARTRIRPIRRPRPGSRSSRHDAATAQSAPARVRHARASRNPYVSAFSALLGLAPELESASPPENPEVLRSKVYDNLIYSRDAVVSAGERLARADEGVWYVAALFDDIVLNTPWGRESGWPRHRLVTELTGDVDAGDRFFDKLDELIRYPDRDPHLLELAFYCLSLGFRGRYRDSREGEAHIEQTRSQISRLLDKGEEDGELSPNWKGVEAPDTGQRFALPLWSIPVFAFVVIAALYVSLGVRLSGKGEQLYTLVDLLPPADRAEIYRPVIENAEPPPAIVLEPLLLEFLPLLKDAAPDDVAAALSGREDTSVAVLVVQSTSPEVFRSARADINAHYAPLLSSIANVITENIEFVGGITVVGHTDSVPVQRSNPFRSNQGLSEARARTIAEALEASDIPGDKIRWEGRADSEPIADNATQSGRAQNRRVEIVIQKKI